MGIFIFSWQKNACSSFLVSSVYCLFYFSLLRSQSRIRFPIDCFVHQRISPISRYDKFLLLSLRISPSFMFFRRLLHIPLLSTILSSIGLLIFFSVIFKTSILYFKNFPCFHHFHFILTCFDEIDIIL